MRQIVEALVDNFADRLSKAVTIKEKIIAERNLVVGTFVVAQENGDPESARALYEQTLIQHGIQETGAFDTEQWRNAKRVIGANIGPIPGPSDPLEILVGLSTGNPYLDISVASHPSNTNRLFY